MIQCEFCGATKINLNTTQTILCFTIFWPFQRNNQQNYTGKCKDSDLNNQRKSATWQVLRAYATYLYCILYLLDCCWDKFIINLEANKRLRGSWVFPNAFENALPLIQLYIAIWPPLINAIYYTRIIEKTAINQLGKWQHLMQSLIIFFRNAYLALKQYARWKTISREKINRRELCGRFTWNLTAFGYIR